MTDFKLGCPRPIEPDEVVVMAHGGGGRVAQRLLETIFYPRLQNPALDQRHDAATFENFAMTTDSFVVTPWKFPGGDIGSLAVHGSVNDLAMAGARPTALTASFILEEGFSLRDLECLVDSMARAASEVPVPIVAGDTKVVERGKCDGIFINTTGIGVLRIAPAIPTGVRPGDQVIVSGDVGRHGAAVMTSREGLALDQEIESDSASLVASVMALYDAGIQPVCMRDATRGGLASILNEIATASGTEIRLDEAAIPVSDPVASVCELLGLDPLYVACEGRFVLFVKAEQASTALDVLRGFDVSAGACRIGEAALGPPRVVLRTRYGVDRLLDLLSGEQLPRIC